MTFRPAAIPRLAICAALALSCAVPARAAPAESTPIERQAGAIFNDYISPYCPGLLLANCPSPAAESLRSRIESALRSGIPAEAVRDALERRFGDAILAAPAARGFGLLAWLTPALFVAGGAAAIAAWLRRPRRPAPPPTAVAADAYSPALRARLDEELRSL